MSGDYLKLSTARCVGCGVSIRKAFARDGSSSQFGHLHTLERSVYILASWCQPCVEIETRKGPVSTRCAGCYGPWDRKKHGVVAA